MIATIQAALMHQLTISNNHLLKTLFDALYSANLFSARCVKSSDDFVFSNVLGNSVVCRPLCRSPRCVHGRWLRTAVELEAISVVITMIDSRSC
jgi:hypothetical protein